MAVLQRDRWNEFSRSFTRAGSVKGILWYHLFNMG